MLESRYLAQYLEVTPGLLLKFLDPRCVLEIAELRNCRTAELRNCGTDNTGRDRAAIASLVGHPERSEGSGKDS